jgi:hypothetical protein
VSATEARLAALCAAAGYPDKLRELIAEATFPGHRAGVALAESELRQLAEAAKLLAQAGRTAVQVELLVAEYQARDGERWRERFWRQALRTAAFRAAHPELYGPEWRRQREGTADAQAPPARGRRAGRARKRAA